MDTSSVCRTCLNTNSLNPIFLNSIDKLEYSVTIFTVTGCKVTEDDGLPQWMCIRCINFVNKSMRFRKRCMETQSYLLGLLSKTDVSNNHPELQNDVIKCEEAEELPLKSDLLKSETENDVKYERNTETDRTIESKPSEQIKIDFHIDTKEDEDDEKPLIYLLETDTDNRSDGNRDSEYLVIDNYWTLDAEKESKPEKQTKKIKKLAQSDNEQETETPYEVELLSDAKTTRVTCKICYQSLSIRSIDAHMAMRHPGKDHRKVQCDLCDKFLLKTKMRRHKMMMHGMTVQEASCLKCVYCKTEYDTKELLLEHVAYCASKKKKRRVNEASREMKECDVCGKSMQKASLRMHKMIKHAGLGPVCEHCGKRFGSKFRLDEHYRAKHGYEKFKCAHCDFKSASVLAMRNHERRHRGEKPYVCEACGAKFHAAYLLTQHKQSHRTERLIKCDQCSATFKANNSLHMHKTTCHSSSLFACTMCSRTYSCRHYVVKHLRHFHQYRGAVGPLPRQDKPRRVAGVAGLLE